MDTSILCVYNLERRVFLSSKVTIVDGLNEPLKVVRLLVSGLGVGAESGLWLTHLHGMLTVPKLFPYDLACLDQDLRVVETIEVIPGIEFPPHRREVASAVVLPPNTLRTTQTRVGDRLIVCPTEQANQVLANVAAAQAPLLPQEEPFVTVQNSAKPGESLANAQGSTVSITEAIVEKPAVPALPVAYGGRPSTGLEDLFANWVDSPAAPPSWIAQKAREHEGETHGIESSAAQKVTKSQDSQSVEPAGGPSVGPPRSESAQMGKIPTPVDRKKEPNDLSSKAPASAVIHQPTQKTTFTIAQYGMWQPSTPPAAGPIASGKRPDSNGFGSQGTAKRDAGSARDEVVPRKNGSIAKKTSETAATAALSRQAEQEPSFPSTEKPPAELQMEKPEPGATPHQTKSKLSPAASALPLDKTPASVPVSTGSSKPADFEATVQNKLDRLQMKAASVTTAATPPKSEPAFTKNPSEEKRESGATGHPSGLSAPETPAANSEARIGAAGRQQAVPMTQPPKHFLTPKTVEKEPKKAPGPVEGDRKIETQSQSFSARFKRWLKPTPSKGGDRRRAQRHYVPGMAAYYFTGGAPRPHDVADISMSGMYVQTDDRWLPDTMIRMTLQKPCAKGEKKQSITVLSRIVRRGSDGVGAEFVMEESIDPNSRDILPSQATDRFSLARFL